MRSPTRTAAILLAVTLLGAACATQEDDSGPATSQLVDATDVDVAGDQGEAGPADGDAIPVEGDGGIGGPPGDGSVQNLLIVDGERGEITRLCLEDGATAVYRASVFPDGELVVTDPDGAATLTYAEAGVTYADDGEVSIQLSPGVLNAQAQTRDAGGAGRYVDATLDVSDLDAC